MTPHEPPLATTIAEFMDSHRLLQEPGRCSLWTTMGAASFPGLAALLRSDPPPREVVPALRTLRVAAGDSPTTLVTEPHELVAAVPALPGWTATWRVALIEASTLAQMQTLARNRRTDPDARR